MLFLALLLDGKLCDELLLLSPVINSTMRASYRIYFFIGNSMTWISTVCRIYGLGRLSCYLGNTIVYLGNDLPRRHRSHVCVECQAVGGVPIMFYD